MKEDFAIKKGQAVLSFTGIVRKKWLCLATVIFVFAILCTGCKDMGSDADRLMLHLSFDEKGGTTVADSAGKAQDAEVHYLYNNAAFRSCFSRREMTTMQRTG